MVQHRKSSGVLKLILTILIVWFIGHLVYISIDGLHAYKGEADVAIILGNRVFANDSLALWTKTRVDKALELYREKRVRKIFASGGISREGNGRYAQGTAMRNYLIKQGVPANDVIEDNDGCNTYMTAKDYLRWNRQWHYQSAIVVSQFYHITRTKYIFNKLGGRNIYGVAATVYGWRDILGALREVPAFYKYVIVY